MLFWGLVKGPIFMSVGKLKKYKEKAKKGLDKRVGFW